MKPREVIARMEADGWYRIKSNSGGHLQFKHPTKPGKVTIPNHPGDIDNIVIRSIEKQSGVRLR